MKESLTRLEKDFNFTFSKIGIKYNTLGQIHNFKQKDHESIRDCVSRLKQLYLRCPDNEKPSQERLIFVFLEGLRNRTLYTHLYPRKHSTFNECCLDAMDYDDNFEMRTDSSQSGLRSPPSTSNSEMCSAQEDRIIERLLQKLGHVNRPQQPFR